jgi:hypothetical protein
MNTLNRWAKVGTNLNLNYTVRNARNNNIFTKSIPAFPLGTPRDEMGNIIPEFIDGELTLSVTKYQINTLTIPVQPMECLMVTWKLCP